MKKFIMLLTAVLWLAAVCSPLPLRAETDGSSGEIADGAISSDPTGESGAAGASGLTGTALNLLFFIEMGGSGEEGYFAEVPEGETLTRREQTLSLFNEQPLGVKNYFAEISGSAFTLHTVEVPGVYVDGHTQAYYLPYSPSNPEGYWQYTEGELKVYDCGCSGTCGENCDEDGSDGMVCLCAAEDPAESLEKLRREQLLVRNALTALLGSDEGQALVAELSGGEADLDGDGLAEDLGRGALDLNRDAESDLLTFYVSGGGLTPDNTAANTAAFWPHKWELVSSARTLQALSPLEFGGWPQEERETLCRELTLDGSKVKNYVLLADEYVKGSSEDFEAGVLCHETIHMLDDLVPGGGSFGVTDLYHYQPAEGAEVPVGVWDIMGVTTGAPQGLNAWYRQKFGWTEIAEASAGQIRYTLYPRGQGMSALRFGDHEGQFFVIEAKTRTADGIDRELPFLRPGETGLLCYRVDPGAAGESGGNIDGNNEIFVLRRESILSSTYLFDGVFTQGESFGSAEAAETENVFGYLTGEGILNSRAVLENIVLNEDGSVSFDLRLEPDWFEVSGTFVFDRFPEEGVQIFRNGDYVLTAQSPEFSLEVREGDLLSFFVRGYELPEVTVTGENAGLGELIAAAKTPVRLEIALTDEAGAAFSAEIPTLLLNGQPFSDFTFANGVIAAELYDTDLITVRLENFTLEDLGEGPGAVRAADGRVTLRVYGYCAVSGQILGEDGQPSGEIFTIYADGLEAGQTDEAGRFSLERVARGTTLTFRGRSHSVEPYTVGGSVSGLSLTAVRNPGALRLPGWTLFVMAVIFVGAVYYYVVVDTRKKYKGARRRRRR